ncbi:MAG: hypothetical protein HY099_01815 [Nitrospirae bacterium]|nr:hypothetical protein [Nitrospirota bacterium]
MYCLKDLKIAVFTILMSLCLIVLCGFAENAVSNDTVLKPVAEEELNSVFLIMKTKKEGRNALDIMAREKISMKRLQEILTDISMLMPYVSNTRAAKAAVMKKPSDAEKKKIDSAVQQSKNYALKYLEKQGGQEALNKSFELYDKYAERIESEILSEHKPSKKGMAP